MSLDAKTLSDAKKGGFKKSKPKKPKTSASISSWERYEERVKDYEKDAKEKAAQYRKKQSIIKKYR